MSEKSFRLFENMIVTRVIPFVSIFIAMAYYLESLKADLVESRTANIELPAY